MTRRRQELQEWATRAARVFGLIGEDGSVELIPISGEPARLLADDETETIASGAEAGWSLKLTRPRIAIGIERRLLDESGTVPLIAVQSLIAHELAEKMIQQRDKPLIDHEREFQCDTIGARFLGVEHTVDALERIFEWCDANDVPFRRQSGRTHPSVDERIAELRKRALGPTAAA